VPIVVDGVMYVTAPDGVYALVPETGEYAEAGFKRWAISRHYCTR